MMTPAADALRASLALANVRAARQFRVGSALAGEAGRYRKKRPPSGTLAMPADLKAVGLVRELIEKAVVTPTPGRARATRDRRRPRAAAFGRTPENLLPVSVVAGGRNVQHRASEPEDFRLTAA